MVHYVNLKLTLIGKYYVYSLFIPLTPVFYRYLAITKGIYKELVTVYKDADTKEVRVSGKAFEITDIKGTELFSGRINPVYSHFYVIIEPMKKSITIMKNTFNEFW